MIYVKNLPLWERLLRIGLGMVAVVYAVLKFNGTWGWVLTASGVAAALTGVFGFCPACALAGRRRQRREPAPP